MPMSQRRGTTTDQLNNVIQVIQLGRKTGVLTVEREAGIKLEMGEIAFTQGQVTYAHVGQLVGEAALQWLSTWRTCRFLFVPPNERITQPLPSYLPPHTSASQQHITNAHSSMHAQDSENLRERVTPASLHNGVPHPRRIRQAEEALRLLEQFGLSRTHRRLLLLIDGRRSTLELVRLMGRTQDDVQRLLSDLERIRVIEQ